MMRALSVANALPGPVSNKSFRTASSAQAFDRAACTLPAKRAAAQSIASPSSAVGGLLLASMAEGVVSEASRSVMAEAVLSSRVKSPS